MELARVGLAPIFGGFTVVGVLVKDIMVKFVFI